MFKSGSFENEVYNSMEKNLVSNQLETKYSFDKLSKAADYLNEAAELFEKAGMYKEAAAVVGVLKSFTHQLLNKI